MTLILASASPTRAAMLRAAGVAFEAAPARIDETEIRASLAAAGAAPVEVAAELAAMKAARASARAPGALALGCDQTAECEGVRFDKPESLDAARSQLRRLRGRTHRLHAAAVVHCDGAEIWRHVGVARLTMRNASDAFLDDYLAAMGAEALETAGGYKLEGRGAQLFAQVEGDWFSIMGLPLLPLLDWLRIRGELKT